ncbi:MAG: ferric reductase-like transmembrane domain-containing protein [Nitrospirae bacterium]|nr:ferric reductase-like transmembrane domain-containing protein [Nitrospirota bacterium]
MNSQLGANPVEKVIHVTGNWALNFVLIAITTRTLCSLPHMRRIGWLHQVAGWAAFFYATLHFLAYAVLEHALSIGEMLDDALRHRRIFAGALAYIGLAAAAVMALPVVSHAMGYARFRALHKVVYPAALCGVVHYVWLVKKDLRAPLIYAAAFAALAAYRAVMKFSRRPV